MTNRITFFESYYTSVENLDKEIRADFYDLILRYSFYGEVPKSDSNPVAIALFNLAKPNIDTSISKQANGKQGGSKTKADYKQTESKTKAKQKQSVSDREKEKEKKRDKEFIPPTINQVKEYQLEKCRNVDAEYFFEYFNSNNWIDSKGNKVKSWKQKMLTWNKSSNNNNNSKEEHQHIGYVDPAMGGYN